MEISFILPLYKENLRIAETLQDFDSFLQKWTFPMEILLVEDPPASTSITQVFTSPHLHLKIVKNSRRLGRGASVQRGLLQAKGRYIFILSADLNVPLAEVFNTLQDFQQNPTIDVIVGNRYDLKKPRHGTRNPWLQSFENAQRERFQKNEPQFHDPTCPFVAFRKEGLEKIKTELKLARWFYTPSILKTALRRRLIVHEKSVVCHDTSETRFGFQEALRSFF